MLQTESNARIHAIATIAVIAVGFMIGISRIEWLAITLSITAVWCAEGFNTAIEFVCDVVSPDYHPKVEQAKDIAAGTVLIAAIGAGVVGVLVFGRHLLALIAS